jgi:hypothetical protein
LESGASFAIWNEKDFGNLASEYIDYRDLPGVDVDEAELYLSANQIAKDVAEYGFENKFELEELYAELLHGALLHLPSVALQDPAFWRYLALFPFRGYLKQREPDLKEIRYGGGSGGSKAKWLLPRTFIWGRKTRDHASGDYSRTHILRELRNEAGLSSGTIIDFYHSHIVRTAWSANTVVAQAFIDSVNSDPLLFDKEQTANRPSNRMARSVARLSSNVLLEFATDKGIPSVVAATKSVLQENSLEFFDVITGDED